MFTYKAAAALFLAVLTVGSVQASGNPTYHRGSLIHSNQPFVRVGGDRVIFGYQVASGCDLDSLKAAAIGLKNRSTTDRWDDQWYAFSVPRGACLVLGYYDLTTRRYGWAAVQNQPNSWRARSANRGWETMANGTQKKYSFTINGQGVDLDIYNPQNEGALTGNDILISFGF